VSQVRVKRLCHLDHSIVPNDQIVTTKNDQGVTDEPISKFEGKSLVGQQILGMK
jgi:hypothetical protein